MKVLVLLIAVLMFSAGCSDSEHNTKGHEVHEKEDAGKLALNNGKKWTADSITNVNVKDLQAVIEKFNASENKSLALYKTTGAELQTGINKLVNDCKMEGPDHDALHQWLLPLIDEVSKLNRSVAEAEATEHMKATRQRLLLYADYFE